MAIIYMCCGLSDMDVSGNQSLKNGLIHLAAFNHEIHVFSFFPNGYPTIQNPGKVLPNNVRFHRLPSWLSGIVDFGRRVKNFVGRIPNTPKSHFRSNQLPNPLVELEYYKEYNFAARMLYVVFLFFIYVPFEMWRVTFFSMRKGRPDIVYGVNAQGSVAASLLGRLFRRPVVTRFHGADMASEKALNGGFFSRLRILDHIVSMRAHSNLVIMTNDGSKGDQILQALGVRPERIRFYMNGVDTNDLIFPEEKNVKTIYDQYRMNEKFTLLMVSRVAGTKRIDRGIACLKWLNDLGTKNVQLLVVGDGPSIQTLRQYAQSLDVNAQVIFAGNVPHNQLGAYYRAAAVFMSLYDRTNLGNPLLEAIYYGCAIITMRDGSSDHLLAHQKSALLVNLDNLQIELPNAVLQFMHDEKFRESSGREARRSFEANVHTWQARMALENQDISALLDPCSCSKNSDVRRL